MRDNDSLILESLYSSILLKEADILDVSKRMPLKDNQSIRVYHGIDNSEDLKTFLEYGTSGKLKAARRYSYESNNNPYGIFVTIDFKIAKSFGQKYIIEFHTKVSDLESPVWPSGGYTTQGQMAQYWKDSNERKEYIEKLRNELKNDKDPAISQSDRPEVADSLYNNFEHQALFSGDLNPNSIKAVWVNKTPEKSYSEYERYERNEFIKKFKDDLSKDGYITDFNKRGKHFLLKPRTEVTAENIISAILNYQKRKASKLWDNMSDEQVIKTTLKSIYDKSVLYQIFWEHQVDKAWEVIQYLKSKPHIT